MMMFLTLASLILILPVLGIWPRIKEGRAFNSIWSIAMPAEGSPKYDTRPYAALYAQELAEFWTAWAVALAIVSPLTLLPFGQYAAIVLSPLAWKWRTTIWGERQLELIGHAAEWIVAERLCWLNFTQGEVALRLIGGYGASDDRAVDLFAGWTVMDVGKALRRRRWAARLLTTFLAFAIGRFRP